MFYVYIKTIAIHLSSFFWIEDFIEINKRQQTHHTHTKYTIYIE